MKSWAKCWARSVSASTGPPEHSAMHFCMADSPIKRIFDKGGEGMAATSKIRRKNEEQPRNVCESPLQSLKLQSLKLGGQTNWICSQRRLSVHLAYWSTDFVYSVSLCLHRRICSRKKCTALSIIFACILKNTCSLCSWCKDDRIAKRPDRQVGLNSQHCARFLELLERYYLLL